MLVNNRVLCGHLGRSVQISLRLFSLRSFFAGFSKSPLCLLLLVLSCWSTINLVGLAAQQRRAAAIQQGKPVDLAHGPKYSSDRILVRFRPGTSEAAMQAAHQANGSSVIKELPIVDRLHVVQLNKNLSVRDAIRLYRKNPAVLYAEPDYIVQASGIPNDPFFGTQWNLHNTGQNGGTTGADIHATEAWDITTGSSNVVVAVIDTGIDYTHADLAANVWSAPKAFTVTTFNGSQVQCAAGSHGFNTLDQSCDPFDDNSHGTHVSGILGAVGNNNVGVAGVNWNVQILPCKFLDLNGQGSISDAITCFSLIKQLKDSGINIVVSNNSWGGSGTSQALQDAVTAQMQDGILLVAAAGNDFSDNDLFPTYPANIFVPNVISVAASTRTDDIVTFSNTGRRTVHIGAPGLEILSTTPNNTYSIFSGTSMAAPHVTGVIALLKAQDPTRDWRALKNLVLAGGDTLPTMGETITQKRLNALGAMTCTNSSVQSRLAPVPGTVSGTVGSPIVLSVLNINCAQPAGSVTVQVMPGNQTITLKDDGTGADQASGDGIYTGQFFPTALGSYTLQFPDGSKVNVEVLSPYGFVKTPFAYQTITGTNLNLGDDSVAQIAPPFPVQFGGGSFNQMFVSSNGTISFTDPFGDYINRLLTPQDFPGFQHDPTTLVAPLWEDLLPVKGTAQNVFWAVTGTAPNRQLVVEWRSVRSFACRTDNDVNVTFEVVFNESTNDIQFNYNDTVFGGNCFDEDDGRGATIGIQSSTDNGVMFSGEAAGSGTSLLWQSPPPAPPTNPAPVLTSISPTFVGLFSSDVTLTANGSGFVFGSLVQFDGVNVPTTFVSSTKLTAILPANLFTLDAFPAFGQPATITVFNPSPGGGTSSGLTLGIGAIGGSPSLTSLSPSSATAGAFSFVLRITGANLRNSTIFWNGMPLSSFAINDTEAVADVSSALIASAGTAQVTAGVGSAGTSNALTFTINAPTAPGPPLGIQQLQRMSIDSKGNLDSNAPPSNLVRFLGWNYGRTKGGPAYFKHFSRPYGGGAPVPPLSPLQSAKSATPLSGSAVSLNSPASLPGFGLHPTLPAGYLPTSVITGDFNKDGKMDWVVSNGGGNDLWLYLGNGDGTAQLPIIIPLTGAAPVQVVAADLRKSGNLDLIVAEADSQTVGVLLGNGDGTFAQEVTYFVSRPPLSIAVGDFNGDGKPDIVIGLLGDESSGPLATLLGDGTGKLGVPIISPAEAIPSYTIGQIVAADLNGDGLTDLAYVDFELITGGGFTYLSRGDGTFKRVGFFNGAFSLALGDMDEDGCIDVVTAVHEGTVTISKGSCDGSFSEFPGFFRIGAGEQVANLAVADMNGDGHLDVVASGAFFGHGGAFGAEATNLITVLPGDGHGSLGLAHVYRSEPSMFGLAVADLNGDSHPDVIAASQDTDTTGVFLNDGHGVLPAPAGEYIGYLDGGTFGALNAPFSDFFVQDIDGDGKPDLAVVESPQFFQQPWQLAVMLNDGTGHFGPAIRSFMSASNDTPLGYTLGDFRNTSRPDLLVFEFDPISGGNPSLIFSPNAGQGHFGPPTTISVDPTIAGQFTVLGTGDFNNDGKLDFILASAEVGNGGSLQMTAFLGNGDGTFSKGATQGFAPNVTTFTTPSAIFVGDFNHDGKLDVLIFALTNGIGRLNHNVFEFLGNGDGTFQPAKLLFQDFGHFTVADLNHDGLPDIVEYIEPLNTAGDELPYGFNIYLGQPDGTFKLTNTYQPYSGFFSSSYLFDNEAPQQRVSPMVADFNGDGNLDIAAFHFAPTFPATTTSLQILAGNGDGTFTPTFGVTSFNKFGFPTTAADVTGDGRADLIEVNGLVSSFHVIPSVPGPAVQLSLPVQPIIGTHGTLIVSQSLVTNTPTTILLSASDPNIKMDSSVTIPAGNLSAFVGFDLGANFNPARVFSITAQLGTQTAVVYSYQTTTAFAGARLFSVFREKMVVAPGGTAGYGVGLTSYGGYKSIFQLSCQGLPVGATCQLDRTTLSITPLVGGSASVTVQTPASIPVGLYTFQIVATDGVVTTTVPLRLVVADFSVALTPASETTTVGKAGDFQLTIGSIGGWTDFVNVTCQVSPPGQGVFCQAPIFVMPGNFDVPVLTSAALPGDYTLSISATGGGVTHNGAPVVLHVHDVGFSVSSFVPVTPCRIADTRNATGPFGGPFLPGGTTRGFVVSNSACNIPATAQAFSLNVTVVPHGPLGFLTMFPCGGTLPLASTLNSPDGRIKAEAAIVPAGTNGDVCAFVTNDTDLVLDINGYFTPTTDPNGLDFYSMSPCRLVDTRNATGPLGGPSLAGNASRTFPLLSSPCNLPSTAKAYSLNYTSVPKGPLGFLTTWPTGQSQPLVSTLNAPTGTVTANAAIVPAGTNGSIDVFVTNSADLVIDVNGYFAPPTANGLSFFTIKPCRVLDSRNPSGAPPITGIDLNVAAAGCNAPASAQSYVLNATVVPQGPLGFLTLWPKGSPQPLVSTLNAGDGAITSNMAIVPANNGNISAFASNATHLVLDINGYFAPTLASGPVSFDVSATTGIGLRSSAVEPESSRPTTSAPQPESVSSPSIGAVPEPSNATAPSLFTLNEPSAPSLSATVASGDTAIYQLEPVAISGFTGVVQFSCSGVPTNATCTVQPDSIDFGTESSTKVSVTITTKTNDSFAPAGNHTITLTATSGEHVQTINLKLNVR